MAVVKELIRKEDNGTISFGNYLLDTKSKVSDFEFSGDIYKVKTYHKITKLERNGLIVYESVPGTSVFELDQDDMQISFRVEGTTSSQITLELEPETDYKVYMNETNFGKMKTNLGGKLVLSVDLNECSSTLVRVIRL